MIFRSCLKKKTGSHRLLKFGNGTERNMLCVRDHQLGPGHFLGQSRFIVWFTPVQGPERLFRTLPFGMPERKKESFLIVGLVSPRIHASPPTLWSVLTNSWGSDWVYHKLGNAPVLRSGAGSWVLSGYSGVRHPLCPVIRLGLRNPRKKERKKERKRVSSFLPYPSQSLETKNSKTYFTQ